MKTERRVRIDPRLVTVVGFVLACVVGFLVLWSKGGGTVPGITDDQYQVSFASDDIKNLRDQSEVRIAGVKVGTVDSREAEGDQVTVTLDLDPEAAPLHEGATVRVGVKSLVGSSFVEVVDGDGDEIPDSGSIAADDVIPAVDVDELLDTLDAPTRRSLTSTIRSLGTATRGQGQSIDATMTGLGKLARNGGTTLDALADQSQDLQALSVEGRRLLDVLDTGQGQIVDVVRDAQRLTAATAEKQDKVEATVRALPGVVTSLNTGAASLGRLGRTLDPIAVDLREAAPYLDQALLDLPATTRDLEGLLPDLDATLDRAPATLTRVPDLDATVRDLVPQAQTLLSDVTPMLAYLEPYGLDVGALFASFGSSFDDLAEDGIQPIRLTATAEGLGTVRGNPVPFGQTALLWNNPYPAPLTADTPRPFRGTYPRIERQEP